MKLGYIGLGKMGMNMVLRLHEKKQDVIAYNRSPEPRLEGKKAGLRVADSYEALLAELPTPRTVWVMVPNNVVDSVIAEFIGFLEKGDTIIDGGNSFYKDSMRRAKELAGKEIHFLDVGTSGGPKGAREGACLMIGGEEEVFKKHEDLFKDIAAPEAYAYLGKAGAGHFTKMVHNGIEYGMMQSLAEGFAILEKSEFDLDLLKVTEIYNHRSVIESRLVGWLSDAYRKFGKNLAEVSGTVSHTGEGEWTVNAGKELGIPAKVIEDSFKFRVESGATPSYIGKILSALRNQFGGHSIETKK
ncbi:MAG: decarboxylating 6-phosphogluconate dehydrogenase [Candidatus Pacebacteria bacterium]|nr:decarboxylating 6-phosphogluconate dehydrogenase [Candidatus Paceibacterota bacterium]